MPFRPLSQNVAMQVEGLRILLAEDDPLIGMEIEDAIADHGGVVYGPYPSLRALLDAVNGPYDVAILDIRLGREESFPAAERLSEAGVPIVFHSGHGEQAEIGRRFPRATLCSKPCAPERLLEASLRAIEQTKQAKAQTA